LKALAELFARRPTLWVWVVSAAFFGTVVYLLASALLSPDLPANLGQPTIKMNSIEGQGERGNQLGWKFVADSSDISTDGETTTYHHVREGIYYLKGKPAYRLTADSVTLDARSQNYTATGDVHIWSVRPQDVSEVHTQNMSWNNALQMLSCPTQVHVKYKGFDMVSSHLELNLLTGSSTLGATTVRSGR
jgi:LPS export ABC transporter protein LptC